MKNLFYLLVFISILGASCGKQYIETPRSSFSFVLLSSTQDSTIFSDEALSINSRGIVSGGQGYQSVQAATAGRNRVSGGLQFKFNFITDTDFTTEEFLQFFEEGKQFALGEWTTGDALYYGKLQNDEIIQYSTVTPTTSESSLTITSSPELVGNTEQGESIYRLDVNFAATLSNLSDEADVITIKEGTATLHIIDFSSK